MLVEWSFDVDAEVLEEVVGILEENLDGCVIKANKKWVFGEDSGVPEGYLGSGDTLGVLQERDYIWRLQASQRSSVL